MNIFGFDTLNAIMALIGISLAGLIMGFILGFARFLLFGFMENKISWSSWGKEVKNI
jgi:hypothetical protein